VQAGVKELFPGELPERKSAEGVLIAVGSLAKNFADSLEPGRELATRTHMETSKFRDRRYTSLLMVEGPLGLHREHFQPWKSSCSGRSSRCMVTYFFWFLQILGLANANEAAVVQLQIALSKF